MSIVVLLVFVLLVVLVYESSCLSYTSRTMSMSISSRINLNDFLSSSSTSSSSTSSSVTSLIVSITSASIEISSILRGLPISNLDHHHSNSNSNSNASGDQQKPLDILSNDILKRKIIDHVKYIISEEDEKETLCNTTSSLLVAMDPLDGSSNIDCNIPVGTIFGVFQCNDDDDVLASTNNIIAAGYVLYSSSTEFVISTGDGTHGFTLDPVTSSYILTRKSITIPKRGAYYSLNEGRSADWPLGLQKYINDIKNGNGQWKGQRYSSRYVCSMVSDLHRTLLYGGWAANPRSHLRLLYEAKPLSFLVEHAQGMATNGIDRILDMKAKSLHDRTPLFMGSSDDILELLSYGDVQQKGNIKY